MLDTITGGIQMYSTLAGHCLPIRPMAEPVLNGRELKRNEGRYTLLVFLMTSISLMLYGYPAFRASLENA